MTKSKKCFVSFKTGLILIFFLFCRGVAVTQVPTVQDCLGAIPVCNSVYSTIQSYTGHGNVYPEIHDNGACPLCMDGEKNDVFYIITVQTSGLLRFILTPNNLNNDYDWAVFNMTLSDCSQLYTNAQALQVSCNSYGVTGSNGATGASSLMGGTADCGGPGTFGQKYNKDITVQAGQTYLINISNWSSTNQSGYTLDFSSSTAVITDNVDPYIAGVQESILCSGTMILGFNFSENVLCTDVQHHPEKFSLTGPGGPYTLTDVTSVDCNNGGHHSKDFVLHVNPPLFEGDYALSVVGQVRDLCTNEAGPLPKSFNLHETNSPSASAGEDETLPYGAFLTLHGSGSGGSGSFAYHWEPASLLVDPDIPEPTTVNLTQTTIFTLTVTDNTGGCTASDEVMITILGGPLAVGINADPSAVCEGESTQLTAMGSGGSGTYTYSWTSTPAGFTSTIPNPVVTPLCTTTYQVQVQDGYSTTSSSVTVTYHPRPVPDAGSNTSIPYGTTTTLHASAAGGSGTYNWLWTSIPPGFTSSLTDPVTPQLEVTTLFELQATDVNTGCHSAAPGQVTVSVTGGPLNTNPIATPPVICHGESSVLNSMAGGGSGNYSYSWTSSPPGFSSAQPSPVVTPAGTTTYFVAVEDGFNLVNGQVQLTVNPLPVIHLGPPDTIVCVYDSLTLDAGNPGSSYLWSNGSVERGIQVGTTGIGFDEQTYRVIVTNPDNCSDSATINVIFSFLACVGVPEYNTNPAAIVYPNPASGELFIRFNASYKSIRAVITDVYGRDVGSADYPGIQEESMRKMDVSALADGLYLLRLFAGENIAGSMKFLVKHE